MFSLNCIIVFASEDIIISVSNSQVQTGDIFELNIEIDTSAITLDAVQFDVPWIEEFEIFSQSQSQEYQNINGEIQSLITYRIGLSTNTQGEYSLGPIRIITPEVEVSDDEVVSVRVSDVVSIPWTQIDDSDVEESGIKWLRIPKFSFWGILWILIVFFTIFYICLSTLFSHKPKEIKKKILVESLGDIYTPHKKYFNKLEKQVGDISSPVFFRKYNIGLRNILVSQWYVSAETDTLKELSSKHGIQENDTFVILKKSYKYEYSDSVISESTQHKYIEDIFKTIST